MQKGRAWREGERKDIIGPGSCMRRIMVCLEISEQCGGRVARGKSGAVSRGQMKHGLTGREEG